MDHRRAASGGESRHQLDAMHLRLLAAITAGLGLASACGGRADSPGHESQAQGSNTDAPSPSSQAMLAPGTGTMPEEMPAPPELSAPLEDEVCYHPSKLAELGLPPGLENAPEAFDDNGCISADNSPWVIGGDICRYDPDGAVLREGGVCCYLFVNGQPACGRPLVVDGRTRRVAELARAAGSREATDDGAPILAIAREWLNDALLEHASIASFSLFGLSLMAIGAPLELVAECQRAVQDEVEHARACFALAARYGAEHAPGRLDLSGLHVSTDSAEIALRTLLDSCVEETVAALTARAQLEVAADVEVRRALERIAEDELRHAELGWKFVAWALGSGDARIARTLRDVREMLVTAPAVSEQVAPTADHAAWHAAGRLTRAEQELVREQALALVIRPTLDALIVRAKPSARDVLREPRQRA